MKVVPFLKKVAGTLMMGFVITTAFAQGITIPNGSTVDVNTGTLSVGGDVTIEGALVSSTGTVALTGDWDNSSGTGIYTSGSGTVEFSGTSAQTLTPGGTGVNKNFNNLTHSGTGATTLAAAIDIDNNFTGTAGTFATGGFDINIQGAWTNTSPAVFTHGSATVTFDGTSQSIVGSSTFWNFSKTLSGAPTRTLTFDNTGEQVIEGTLTLTGHSGTGTLLNLRSDSAGNQFDITLKPGGFQSLSYLDVKDSNAAGGISGLSGLTLVAGTTSTDSLNNTNWVFGAATLTWDGDVDSDWETPGNWDLGFVPNSTDSVIIPTSLSNYPDLTTLAGAGITVDDMTIQSGATVTLNQKNLTITDTLFNEGTIILDGNETVAIGTPDTDSGTFRFIGDGDGSTDTRTIPNESYFNVVFNDSAVSDTYRTPDNISIFGTLDITDGTFDISTGSDALTVSGTLTVNGGTLTATSGSIDANSDVVITSGALTAPSSTFTIGGDFQHSTGGTFTHSSGTVTFDGTAQAFVGDQDTTFYTFSKVAAVNDTLTFTTSATQTFVTSLTMTGTDATKILSIDSDSAGAEAFIVLQTGGLQTLNYLEVRDSNASGGVMLVGRNSTQPSGNNTNWIFGAADLTWEGDLSVDWDTAGNWDLGLTPIAGDNAIVPNVGGNSYPTLSSTVSVADLTLSASVSVVTLDGNDLAVTDTLSNLGNISAVGSETIAVATPDTDSGTFTFVGNGDDTNQARTVPDLDATAGNTDYYNLVINDPDANNPDTFSSAGDLVVANDLTVSGGELNALSNDLDINASVSISGATSTLTAPGAAQSFTVATNWSLTSSGTFTNSSGEVTFDTTNTTVITGDSTFEDLTAETGGKTISFTATSNQTVNGTITFIGSIGNLITLQSTLASTDWNITIPNGQQGAQLVVVSDSEVLSAGDYDITCFNCTNSGGNDDGDADPTAHWIFSPLSITTPSTGKTTDTTPTVIGTAAAGDTVTIQDITATVVATTTADSSGNWRVEVDDADAITAGANSLRPFVGGLGGVVHSITAVASPTVSQQPTITSPSDGDRLHGSLPTIVGQGLASTSVTIVASDSLGNLLLQTVGSGATDGSTDYSTLLTTALTKGTIYVSVTVDDVASDIFTYKLTDPFGIIFDSASNNPIEGAEVSIFRAVDDVLAVLGVDLDASDSNPVTTGSDGFYSFLTAPADYYITVTAAGFTYPSTVSSFPAGRIIITGSKGEQFTVASTIIEMDHPMDASASLLRIQKDVNKKKVKIGDIATYTITIENLAVNSTSVVGDVHIEDNIPPGFKYITDRVTLDGTSISDPTGNRPLDFDIGEIPPATTKILKYQLVVGAGVVPGDYENKAVARQSNGNIISNRATETIEVVVDPLFDLGTVIGKVFFDKNENGIQDMPEYSHLARETIMEEPIPNITIVMEDGTVIHTDKNGMFNVPGIMPGRHLFRLDERTLPKGSYLTTDKVVVVDVTEGMIFKVNFGVQLDEAIYNSEDSKFFADNVTFSQDTGKAKPRLNVDLFGGEVVVYNDIFIERVEFRIFTNYTAFIEDWTLKIIDKNTKRAIKTFDGDRTNIFDPIYWDGKNETNEFIRLDREYAYVVMVRDKNERFDETETKLIAVREIEEDEMAQEYLGKRDDRRKSYKDWANKESKSNSLSIQNNSY